MIVRKYIQIEIVKQKYILPKACVHVLFDNVYQCLGEKKYDFIHVIKVCKQFVKRTYKLSKLIFAT